MNLLLAAVVVGVASGTSYQPDTIQGRRFDPVPIYIYGPQLPDVYGPVSQRKDFLEHILFDYRVSPEEVNIRHRGQNPISYTPPKPLTYIAGDNSDDVEGFHRGHVESHPSQQHHSWRPYSASNIFDEEEGNRVPLRDAVESIPVPAQFYFTEPNDESDDLPFSRSDVESYPRFPAAYTGGFEDEDLNAVVMNVRHYEPEDSDDKYGFAGYRASVESIPLRTPQQDPEEAFPMVASLNARPFGHFSESTLDATYPEGDSDVAYKPQHPWSSWAQDDLAKFKANVRAQNGDYKLVCYYGGWSVYRPAPFDFSVNDIDPFSCTHVIYSFAGLTANDYTIQALDEELDIIKGAYKSAVALKAQNPALKVMIAIGGWNEGGKKYSEMASTQERRDRFVRSVVDFLQEHHFDGLDLDWEYPGASDRGGRWGDKKNFADLVEELAGAFKPYGWILSAAVSPAKFRVNEGYDVPRLAKHLDFINIMTYDLRGPWDGKADHHSPIQTRPSDAWAFKSLNTKDGIGYWVEKGAPAEKLVLGVPFYGRSFTLSNPSNNKPGSRVKSGGKEGQYTQERGFLAYYEICMEERNGGWTYKKDAAGGPYMYKDDQWIGYDDTTYVAQKMDMVKTEGLAGAMIWAIDLDDYLGVCGNKWPLLSTMRRGLGIKATGFTSPTVTIEEPQSSIIEAVEAQEPPQEQESQPAPEPEVEKKPEPKPDPMDHTIRPASPSPDTSLTGTGGNADVGVPCTEGSYQRDAHDCKTYYLCVHGDWDVFYCPPPLQWDQNKRICDWPSNVKCKAVPQAPGQGADSQGLVEAAVAEQTQESGHASETVQGQKPVSSSTVLETVSSSGKLSGDYMVVCYFTNWAWYRSGVGKYKPEDIDDTICTHIVYGFAVLDYSNLVIKPHDSWADIDNKFYEKVVALKKKGIKVTIALGGWNDSQGDKYSRLVNSPSARKKFTDHVIQFIQKYGFDGLDLDWEYPVCWQVNCKKGPKSDKENFALWVKELKQAFEPHGLLLSAAVSPSKKVIDEGYDVPTINHYLDWIAVMTYDFHGHWDKKTGHVAPMYHHPETDYDYFNMDFAIRYWLEKGATKDKIVLGMPLYGQSFSLNDPQNTGLNSPARTGGQAGSFTKARGFLAYYEICHNIKKGWTVVKDPENRIGPYAYSGNQWVSFDDTDMIKRKSQYIRDMGLAGGMVWALDLDDFRNTCGQGSHPLMNTIKSVLGPPRTDGSTSASSSQKETSSSTTTTTTEGTIEAATAEDAKPKPNPGEVVSVGTVDKKPDTPSSTGTDTSAPPTEGYKVVCYFTNWAWYRTGEGKYTPSEIDPSLCTHIVYGFAVLDTSKLVIKPHDTWADFDNKFYQQVTEKKKNGVKVLIGLGGWNDSAGNKYSRLVSTRNSRRKFIEHVIAFIKEHNFDGLDLDWEYPVCWQVDCKKGPASDKERFADFVRELHEAFQPHGLLLSAAVSPSNKVIDAGYDVPALDMYLDWIAVMTYDYHGQWDKQTGHVAPMYAHPDDVNPAFNTDFTIKYWIEKGARPEKLVLGMPMYGQSFTLAQSSNNGLNQKTYGGGEAGQYTRARGFMAYYEICYKILHDKWTVVRDPQGTMGPYAYKGDQWVGFDDIEMIKYKTEYLKKMKLGGAMIWALDLDDFKNRCNCGPHPLLKTINSVLGNKNVRTPGCARLGGSPMRETDRPTTGDVPAPAPVLPTPVEAPQPPVERKPCNMGKREAHLSDCRKFYECEHGEKKERQCFPGLHWNEKAQRCDWPSEAKCRATKRPDQPTTATKKPTTKPTTTEAPPKTTQPIVTPGAGTSVDTSVSRDTGYKVVCYFTNWAWYRQGSGKYRPEDIDTDLCTHIVYGFAVLDGTKLTMRPHDSWADIDNKFYEKVTALKARGVKVLIALGGWNDSAGDKYSRLVNDPAARARFNAHVIEFIQKYNFDGLDLDWEYPVCWQVDCSKGPVSDKQAFADWIRELHYDFQPLGLLLSAAVSPSNKVIDAGYDVPAANRYLDWIAVMTYDYHGHWDKKTGHVAPMYHNSGHPNPAFNANFTINYWLEKGADRKKLVMGMPMYGQAFGLGWKADGTGLGQHAPQKGQAGRFTRAAGFLAYYEICYKVQNEGYTVVKDPQGTMGPYAYKGKQWFGYDDIAMIRYKSEYVKSMGLGGAMIWALDLDDFRNRCACEPHPLLRTINRVLRDYSVPDPNCKI